jgi:hypothetical protein
MPKPDQSVQMLAATDPLARAADALRGSSSGLTDSDGKKKDRKRKQDKLEKVAKHADDLSREVSKHAARSSAVPLRGNLAVARLKEGRAKLKALSKSAGSSEERKALKKFAARAKKLGRAVKHAAR